MIIDARVSGVVPLGDASLPAAFATDAFIAAFFWQPLSGSVMDRRERTTMR
jgi:hypothetical protein